MKTKKEILELVEESVIEAINEVGSSLFHDEDKEIAEATKRILEQKL